MAKIGVDTAENEPLEVWGENSIQYSLHSLIAKRTSVQARLSVPPREPGDHLLHGSNQLVGALPTVRRELLAKHAFQERERDGPGRGGSVKIKSHSFDTDENEPYHFVSSSSLEFEFKL